MGDETSPAADAIARLDFPAALEELDGLIAAEPTAARPRLARAALHLRMQRPALAIADLDAVLDDDPANADALSLRAEILAGEGALERARADLSAALETRGDDPALLARRAAINAQTGRSAAAIADYDAALALTPDDTALREARAALGATTRSRAAEQIVFGEEAVMSDEFRIERGAPEAPNTLHIVHASTDLDSDATALDPGLVDRAIAAGALKVVHLFTYTGAEASIWGNLGMICAGPDGFAATYAALSDTSGQAAIDAAGAGDTAPLERLLTAAYSVGGIDEARVAGCALDRLTATRYLTDWQTHRDAGAWRGVNLLDSWPNWVLNGESLAPAEVAEHLAALATAPDSPADTADAAETMVSDAAPSAPADPVADTAPDPAPDDVAVAVGEETPPPAEDVTEDAPAPAPAKADPGTADAVEPNATAATEDAKPDMAPSNAEDTIADPAAPTETVAEAPAAPVEAEDAAPAAPADAAAAAPETADAAPVEPETAAADALLAPVRFPTRPEPADDARVPVDLRGVYAASLGDCISYLDTIEAPDRIDAVLPAINPLDGPVLGTILVTSRRVYPFNPADTECAIAADQGSGADWQGDFTCQSPLAPDTATDLRLAPAGADGTAPRISARYGAAAATELRQCRTLGQLGNIFAPLWSGDDDACTVSAPLARGRFDFSVDQGGNLVLRVAPTTVAATAGRSNLHAVVDGAAVGTEGRWDGTGWQVSLGPFEQAAESLGWGMFLDVRASGDVFEARLPLFGSSAAMDRLAACGASD